MARACGLSWHQRTDEHAGLHRCGLTTGHPSNVHECASCAATYTQTPLPPPRKVT